MDLKKKKNSLSYYNLLEYEEADCLFYLYQFSEYEVENMNHYTNVNFFYENKESDNMARIRVYYKLDHVMGDGNEMQRILRLLKWTGEHFKINGKTLEDRKYDSEDFFDILNRARMEGYVLNCRYISTIFTQILLSVGFKTRWVVCMPIALEYRECHCVVEVYIEALEKWILVDPSYKLLYFNKKGELINLHEMRSLIIKGEKFRVVNTPHHYDDVWNCWINHIFRFKYSLSNEYNMLMQKNKSYACLNPKNFVINDKRIIHSEDDVTVINYYYNKSLFY